MWNQSDDLAETHDKIRTQVIKEYAGRLSGAMATSTRNNDTGEFEPSSHAMLVEIDAEATRRMAEKMGWK